MSDHSSPLPDRQTLEAWDDAYVWHPFTPHAIYREEEPLMVVEAQGHYLIDADGSRYLDGVSSIWCNALGHRHPRVDAALHAQVDKLAHSTFLGHASAPAVMLAKRLVELAPKGLSRVFYSDNGSTATEIALKMAYQYWQQVEDGRRANKRKILALTNAYNGDTLGAVSVGGIDLFHAKFRDLLFETVRGPSPYCYRCPLGLVRASCQTACLDQLVALIEAHKDELAAVIMEPGMQGAGGMIVYPPEFLRTMREVTARHDIFLILDEVAVGVGRSGAMFACEREGVVPDFLCVAKMLTNGYLPMAATLTTERVFEGFVAPAHEGKTFYHGHTFTGNALGAAVALATLEVLTEEGGVLGQVDAKIARLGELLERFERFEQVGQVRQFGLGAGIELVQDRATKAPFDASERRAYKVCRYARERGVFVRPLGDVLVVMPPLTITDEELELLVDALVYGLEREFLGKEAAR